MGGAGALDADWVGGDGIGGEFNRAQGDDEKAGAGARYGSGSFGEAELGVEIFSVSEIGEDHGEVIAKHNQITARSKALSGGDDEGFRVGRRAGGHGDLQTMDDAEAGGFAEACLAHEEVTLVAAQILGGEEAPIEPERAGVLAAFDDGSRALIGGELGVLQDRVGGGFFQFCHDRSLDRSL